MSAVCASFSAARALASASSARGSSSSSSASRACRRVSAADGFARRARCVGGSVRTAGRELVAERVAERREAGGGVGDAFEPPRARRVCDFGISERDGERALDFVAVFGHVVEQRTEPGPALAVEATQLFARALVARGRDLRRAYVFGKVEIRGQSLGFVPGQLVDGMGRLRRPAALRELAGTGRVTGFAEPADERGARRDEVRRCGRVELVEG